MRGEFSNVAEQIVSRAIDGGISVTEIGELISQNGEVNCYPGIPSNHCCITSYFIALKESKLARGKEHLTFTDILTKLIQHTQGSCIGITRNVVIITTSWWSPDYEKWFANIEAIKHSGVLVEVYLIGVGGSISRIDI